MGRLIVLSGPSCVGKGPLCATLKRLYPELAKKLHKLVLYNSRAPRPGEVDGVDYHFRPRAEIEALRNRDGFVVMKSRNDLGALDLREMKDLLETGDVLYEGNPTIAVQIIGHAGDVECVNAFLSPLSREEIEFLKAPQRHVTLADFVADVMRRKLLKRTQKQKGTLSLGDLQDIETRCTSAYSEMKLAHRFDRVIVNHDGEDSDNWTAHPYPIADARRTLLAFVDILQGDEVADAEIWDEKLLP